jgi:hypothetical protein
VRNEAGKKKYSCAIPDSYSAMALQRVLYGEYPIGKILSAL